MYDYFQEVFMSFLTLEKIFEYIFYLALFNLFITIIEFVYDYFKKNKRDYRDDRNNIFIGIVYEFLDKLTVTSIGFSFLFVIHLKLQLISYELTILSWLCALLLADLTYYWMHRLEHKVRLLWAYHSVHHSSLQFNMLTGYRLSWVEGFFEWLFLIPMILIGFSPIQSILSLGFVALYQHWIHTERIGKLGFLEGIINTPSAHRVHHASNEGYTDKNFGGILIIWDRIFKTYQQESFEVVYGIGENVDIKNPFKIQFHEFLKIGKEKWPTNQKKII